MKTRLLFAPLLLALVASLAACGGGSTSKVPADAVAVVGTVPITTAEFNTLFKQAQDQAKSRGGTVPTPGSPQYTQMRNQVIAYLVQVSELKQQAPKEGASVSSKDIDKYLANLAKTRYGGSMTKLTQALKLQGLTMAAARQQLYVNLLAQKIHTKVTKSATVTDAQVLAYYRTNIQQYSVAAQTSRSVRHILVKSKTLADQIERQVTNANFARLAKKYSIDTTSHKPDGIGGSAANGGKLTAIKGQLVKSFEDVAFSLKTGQISKPVQSQYGWHIIQALANTVQTKAHVTPFAQVKAQIKTTLLTQAQDQLWQQWLSDLAKQYQGKVSYQTGYAPPTTTALPTTT